MSPAPLPAALRARLLQKRISDEAANVLAAEVGRRKSTLGAAETALKARTS